MNGASFVVDRLRVEGLPRSPLSFRASAGEVTALCGPTGSGRTSLLLALAGRLEPLAGGAEVDGLALPGAAREVRRRVAVARAGQFIDLGERSCVEEALVERAVRRAPTGEVDDALRLTGAPRDPDAHADQRTRVAMALAFLDQPAAIVIDDVGRGVTAPEESGLWRAFHDVAAQGPTVLGTTSDPDAAAAGGARVVSLC
jgi:ABC-type multidrug transport system ATPase subunit